MDAQTAQAIDALIGLSERQAGEIEELKQALAVVSCDLHQAIRMNADTRSRVDAFNAAELEKLAGPVVNRTFEARLHKLERRILRGQAAKIMALPVDALDG